MRAFSSPEVSKITGISYRQLDYWIRRGAIIPSLAEGLGSGNQRRFSETDIRKLFLCRKLVEDCHVPLGSILTVLDYVLPEDLTDGAMLAVFQDRTFQRINDPNKFMEWLPESGKSMFIFQFQLPPIPEESEL